MLDINGNEFAELVRRAVNRVLAERQGAAPLKRRVYVVLEPSFDVRYDSFLQAMTERDDITVIVPEAWSRDWNNRIQADCPFCRIVSQTGSANLPLEGSLTVYPVASPSFIAKAALCISDDFATQWLARCMAAGAAVHVMLSGLTRFTGKEPPRYVETILAYYRMLLTYDVTIGKFPASPDSISRVQERSVPQGTLTGHIVTAADIYPYGNGAVLMVPSDAIITAFAQEAAERQGVRLVRRE